MAHSNYSPDAHREPAVAYKESSQTKLIKKGIQQTARLKNQKAKRLAN